jgi:ATP/ADP translocase/HEAT repeat protein
MVKSKRISAAFNVQPGEGQMVSLLLLQYFLLGGAFNFVQTAAFSLFLVEFSAQTLAYVYIANAMIVPLITTVYLRLGQRISFPKLLAINLGFLLALVVAFWLALGFSGKNWVIFALPILFQILVNLGNLSFWPLAGRLFNVRQGKRLFGLVGAGQWIAIVLTGFLIPTLVSWIGTGNLLILGAISLFGALAINRFITRLYAAALHAPLEKLAVTKTGRRKSSTALSPRRSRYVLLLFALAFLWWLAFFFLDNLFYAVAAVQYPEAQELASFLGLFLGGLGILTLISNFFLTGPVISRFGLQTSLLILPALLFVGTSSMALLATLGIAATMLFWLATGNKLLDMALGFSIDRTAQTILFQPMPPGRRLQTQTMAEGVIQPLANGAAGLSLLALGALFASYTTPLIMGVLVIVIAWAVIAFWLGREYPKELVQALDKRRLEGIQMQVCDASSLSALKKGLRNPQPAAAIYAANTLESIDPGLLAGSLPELLQHPAADVRLDALQRVERLGLVSLLPVVKEIQLRDTSLSVQATALQTQAALGKSATFNEACKYLEHLDPRFRLAAIIGLVHSGEADGLLVAKQKILSIAVSPNIAERTLAANALGEIEGQGDFQALVQLLGDNDPTVQREAIKSAGRLNHPQLWLQVIQSLDSKKTHGAAEAALVSGGKATLPAITKAFTKSETSRQSLISLARACGRIQGDEAIALLKNKIDVPDVEVRDQILRALSRCGYKASAVDSEQVMGQIRNELSLAAWVLGILNSFRENQPITLLKPALESEIERSLERTFFLLSFIAGGKAILRARDNLRFGSPEKRAYALEVLDVSIPNSLKSVLFPFVEELTSDQRLIRLAAFFPQPSHSQEQGVKELLISAPGRLVAWTKAAVLLTVRETSQIDLSNTVKTILAEPEPILRETAIWTLAGLHPAAQEIDQALLNDPDPGVARIARYWNNSQSGAKFMLSTVEKVIILKGASIFAETPDAILAEVAQALEEIEIEGGEIIFEKGDSGDSMYILASGKVRVHDGAHTLNTLVSGDVFGEMALLDPEPRVASVTAEEYSQLLRLDQDSFYDLMADQIEVAHGIIKVLSNRLRERVHDLNELRADREVPILSR